MQVARAYAIDDVRLETAAVPEPGPGDALLKVEACGLCTSDCLDWYVAKKAPIVLGHEPAGTLVAVGKDVRGFAPGQRVFTHHHVPCGECPDCRRGADTSCLLFKETALDPGGFAHYLKIPAANLQRDTLALPDAMDWETATWIEPLACSLRVFARARPLAPGATVAIIGLGSMGLLNAMCARVKGAGRVIGSDPVEVRRAKALQLGFDAVLDPTSCQPGQGELPARLREANGGALADLVIVGPGYGPAIEQGLTLAAPGGSVVLFSPSPPGLTVAVSPHALYFSEICLTSSYSCGPRETREALALLQNRAVDPAPLVTLRVGLSGVAEAIRRTVAKGADLKAVVYPQRP